MKAKKKFYALVIYFCLILTGSGQLLFSAPVPETGIVLDTAGVWRMYHTLEAPALEQNGGKIRPLLLNVKWLDWTTPPPADNWKEPEMDDRGWLRGPARRSARTPYLARLCMRGKFEVTNLFSVNDLSLMLEYYGGVIVYLNGKEIGRKNIPATKDSKQLLAEAYSLEAFVDAKGEVPRTVAPALRTRMFELLVPRTLLKKGVNVLALELIRAPYPELLEKKKTTTLAKEFALIWNTCEIRKVRLSAKNLTGLVPNAGRPKGIQVWNAENLAGDVDVDYGDLTETLKPLIINSPRNGAFYGKVILGSDKPIKGLKVTAGDLKSGEVLIPASQVQFLYGIPGGQEDLYANDEFAPPDFLPYKDGAGCLGMLLPEPLKEFPVAVRSKDGSRVNGAVVPLWVRVKVPKNSEPGTYKGTVTVSVSGEASVQVPVELKVFAWTLPDVQDFKTWVELIQSPDSLAVEYNVPLWSEKHFKLIERSFKLISATGARSLYIPAIAHTNLGNEESMIRWIKKADGKYDWDFSVMDKYLDTAEKYLGKPKLVVLQVWEVYMNTKDATGRRFGLVLEENQKTTGGAPLVTFVNADKSTKDGSIPKLSNPVSKAIWRELLAKVRARLKERGLEKTLQLGMFTDSTPNKEDTKFFLELAPDLPWVQQGHNAFKDLNGIAKVGYTATWWSQRFADDLENIRQGTAGTAGSKADVKPRAMTSLFGWNRPQLDAYYPRMANETGPISYWYYLCEFSITGDFYRGIGRVGADYWPAVKKDGRRVGWVNERFSEVLGYLHQLHSYVLEPREDGPAAMTRLLALEEGIQDCEARIYIENALVNRSLKSVAPELAKRCQEALDERLVYMWKGLDNMNFGGWGVAAWRFTAGVAGHAWLLNTSYRERTEKLYTLAGEVEAKMGKENKKAR